MSKQYPGGFITKTPTAPTSSSAPGIWTLDQAMQNQKAGNWPSGFPNYIEDVFSTYVYTGTGSNQTLTTGINLSANGGLIWSKRRSAVESHFLQDTTRGLGSRLSSNTTSAAATGSSWPMNAISTTGMTVDGPAYAANGETYVSWTFREQAKFFDIVTYTGNATSGRQIAHSLGSAPGMIIVKRTDATRNWVCYHQALGNGSMMILNSTASVDNASALWNNTTPTSTYFTVNNDLDVNGSGANYVAYIFAHNAGGFGLTGSDNVISCGSYTGSGAAGNPITLGYEPQWVLIKNTTNAYKWLMFDNMRGFSMGTSNAVLAPNLSDAEVANGFVQPTSTGFNFSSGGSFLNGSGENYIYIAIRRGPMKVPTVGTTVFSPTVSSATTGTAVTTSFPIDLQIQDYRTTPNSNFVDRLRGFSSNSTESGVYVRSVNTNAEASGSVSLNWNNTSFQITSGFSGADTVYYNFRRAPSFFDEVCYTGNYAGNPQIPHNLTVAPELIIAKVRSTTGAWYINSPLIGTNFQLAFNASAKSAGSTYTLTSTYFQNPDINYPTGETFVAYLFATCAGVSKVGTYTGTAALLTVNCGFTSGARFVLIKRTDSSGDWYTYDSARGISSGTDPYLLLNDTAAEVTGTNYVDTDTTGFKVTAAAPAGLNASGGTYIFLAIA